MNTQRNAVFISNYGFLDSCFLKNHAERRKKKDMTTELFTLEDALEYLHGGYYISNIAWPCNKSCSMIDEKVVDNMGSAIFLDFPDGYYITTPSCN